MSSFVSQSRSITIDFPTTANVSDCLDEDNMASNSATSLATQQSIKAYVDATVVTQANQAAVEAETNEDTYVPPDLLRHQPGIAKGRILLDGTGTIADLGSYNVFGIADDGTGLYTVTWDTDFSSAVYQVAGTAVSSGGGTRIVEPQTFAVGSLAFTTVDDANSASDSDNISIIAFGDQ